MRARSVTVLVGVVLAAAASGVLLWFFSHPAGVSRQQATSNLATFAMQTLKLSAVTGFAAMATLEMVKRLFHLRGRFFYRRVPGSEFLWSARPEKSEKSEKSAEVNHEEAVRRFDIPLEQLMAQLGYATDQALDRLFPERTGPARRSPLRRTRLSSSREPYPGDRVLHGTDDYELFVRLVGEASTRRAIVEGDPTMLRLETQAALDDLQVSVGNAWRWLLRLTSCVLAALFALVALVYVPVPPGVKIAALAGSFLLGGFFAGFFRDLAAIVERFRGLCCKILHISSRSEPKIRVEALRPHERRSVMTRVGVSC